MQRLIILILSVLLFTSCMTRRKCQQYCDAMNRSHITDTNTYVEKVRDTTIVVPPDSAIIQALFECDSIGQIHIKELHELKSKGLETKVEYGNNTVYLYMRTDENKIRLKYLDIFKGRILTKTVVNTVEVKRPINKFFLWASISGWGIIILWLIFKYLRIRFRLLFGINKNYD